MTENYLTNIMPDSITGLILGFEGIRNSLVILNGPTVGVDVGAKQDIHSLVHDLANEGLAVIIISDDLPEVVVNCNRVLVMKDGEIVGKFDGDEVQEEAIVKIIS